MLLSSFCCYAAIVSILIGHSAHPLYCLGVQISASMLAFLLYDYVELLAGTALLLTCWAFTSHVLVRSASVIESLMVRVRDWSLPAAICLIQRLLAPALEARDDAAAKVQVV